MTETLRRCYVCDGEMTWDTADHYEEDDGRVVVVRAPAIVCQLCGLALFTSRTLDAIDRVLRDRPPTRTLEAVVYDLCDVGAAPVSS